MKMHVNWAHASAQQVARVLVDSDGNSMYLFTRVDEVSQQREVRRAFDEAPKAPSAGASAVAMANEMLQVDFPFPDDIIALQAMDIFHKNSLLKPVRTQNPQEVRDACRSSRIGSFASLMSIQMDEGGEWRNGL